MFEDAAHCRARESTLLWTHGHSVAAVYLAGYVVECRLKALLRRQGKRFRRSGREGHDLISLWDQAGLRSKDLTGHRAQFIQAWNTSLRYRPTLPDGTDAANLFTGGKELAAMISTRIRYTKPLNKQQEAVLRDGR